MNYQQSNDGKFSNESGEQGYPGNYGPQNPMQGNHPQAFGITAGERNPPPDSGHWNASLFGCGGDCLTCCIGCWCPCVLIGQNIEIIDRGATPCTTAGGIWGAIQCLTLCGFAYSFMFRQRFREHYGLPSALPDIITECCCQSCSACQIHQEFKTRSIDPSLGYERVRHIYDQPYNDNAPTQQQMK